MTMAERLSCTALHLELVCISFEFWLILLFVFFIRQSNYITFVLFSQWSILATILTGNNRSVIKT